MIPPWLLDGRSLKALTRVVVVCALFSAVGLVLCLGRAYWASSKIKASVASEAVAQRDLIQVKDEIQRASALKKPKTPDPQEACTEFQTATQHAAQEAGASIGEFDTSPEVQVYLSKYTNDSPPEGWKQVTANFSLTGTAQAVFGTLDGLRQGDIPFEIDGLEVTRTHTDRSGESTVQAHVQARVLMRA